VQLCPAAELGALNQLCRSAPDELLNIMDIGRL
jgi:hypothetical protein